MTRVNLDQLIHGETRDAYSEAHALMKADSEIWQSLAFAGIQHDDQGKLADLRHCPFCQSTLLRSISSADALYLCQMQAEIHARSMAAISEAAELPNRPSAPRDQRESITRITV